MRPVTSLPLRRTPITRRFRLSKQNEELAQLLDSVGAGGLSLCELQEDRECIVAELESFGMMDPWEKTVRVVVADPISERERRVIETRATLEARVDAHNQRAVENGKIGTLTVGDWLIVCSLFEHCCAYCGRRGTPFSLSIEHFVPISKGGDTRTGNIVPACSGCNSSKGAKMPGEWLEQEKFLNLSTILERLGL